MTTARTIERAAGILTFVIGGASLIYAVFRPTYTDGQGNWRSIAEMSLNPGSVTFLLLMLLAMAAVVVGAIQHSQGRGGAWLSLVGAGALALLLGTLLSLLSIGLLLVPALLGAIVTLAGGLALTTTRPRGTAS